MRNSISFITLLFLIIFIQSCTTDYDSKELLSKAEKYVITHPDSSLYYLGSIISPDRLNEKDYALYTILLVRTHNRNRISLVNDTIIQHAIAYYSKTDDKLNLARAYLQAGRVAEEREELAKAKQYYQDATILSLQYNYPQLYAICVMEAGELSFFESNYDDALKWFNIALEYYKDKDKRYFALKRVSDCHILTNQTGAAIGVFEKIKQDNISNTILTDVHKNEAVMYFISGEYMAANQCINKSLNLDSDKTYYPIQCLIKADIHERLNQSDSVIFWNMKAINHAKANNSLDLVYNAHHAESKQKYYLKVTENIYWNTSSDSIFNKSRYQTVTIPKDLYNKKQLQMQNQSLVIHNQRYIIAIITSLILSSLIIASFFKIRSRGIKRHKKVIKENKQAFDEKEESLINKLNLYKGTLVEKLYLYRRLTILSLSNNDKYDKLLDDYNRIVFNNNDKFKFDWDVTKGLINLIYDNFEEKLVDKYSDILTENEIHVILLQKAGFEINEICEILDLSSTTIYHRNSDIRKKLGIKRSGNILQFFDEEDLD